MLQMHLYFALITFSLSGTTITAISRYKNIGINVSLDDLQYLFLKLIANKLDTRFYLFQTHFSCGHLYIKMINADASTSARI